MKYAVEMASGDMMYILSFMKIGIGLQMFFGRGIHRKARSPGNRVNSEATFTLKIRQVG
jgi:hypothetical protein